MIAFDIGCNIGDITKIFLKDYDSVLAVDANPHMCDVTKQKYGCKNLKVLNYAVSNTNDELLKFNISDAHTISTLSDDWMYKGRFAGKYKWNKVIDVKSITLDKLIELYGIPHIIKIDVEGYEYEVLKGLSHIVNYLYFEWTEEFFDNSIKCVDHLKNIGYKKFGFTYMDGIYDPKEIEFKKWDKLSIHNDIDHNRKKQWGNIWTKVNEYE